MGLMGLYGLTTNEPGFPFCLPRMAPLYTREPPSPRDCVRRTIRPGPNAVTPARADVSQAGCPCFQGSPSTPLLICVLALPSRRPCTRRASACRDRQRPDPLEHRPEQASGQVTLRQEQPVVARVFYQSPARLDQALLQAGQ